MSLALATKGIIGGRAGDIIIINENIYPLTGHAELIQYYDGEMELIQYYNGTAELVQNYIGETELEKELTGTITKIDITGEITCG